jgi:hypothetical protein
MKFLRLITKDILSLVLEPDTMERIGRRYHDTESYLSGMLSPTYRASVRRLMAFKNKHRGERCFIIGNGPSLSKMDLLPLKKEITFGLNRIYLLFDRLGFSVTYFVSVNPYVVEQSAEAIERLPCTKFIGWDAGRLLSVTPDTVLIRSRSGPRFCTDVSTQGVWEGATVTYVAMQIAYFMGFSEVILIGVDHDFKTTGEPNELVVSQGADPNHFDPNYFGKGMRWQLPDLETSKVAYVLAKEAYEKTGRRIVDATVGGKLAIFPKVRYEDVIGSNEKKEAD